MKTTLIILTIHWIFDFVFQTDKMALNKSKDNYWLFVHVAVYSIGLAWIALFIIGLKDGIGMIGFIILNALLHFVTDWCTSRLNAHLWKKEMRHWFFVAVGFDQLLHYAALFGTLEYL